MPAGPSASALSLIPGCRSTLLLANSLNSSESADVETVQVAVEVPVWVGVEVAVMRVSGSDAGGWR